MNILQNIFKRKNVNNLTNAEKKYIQEASEISDEEALENAKREDQYYKKAKAVEEIVTEILKKRDVMVPVLLSTSDFNLLKAKKILEIKNLSMPDTKLEELIITKEDIKAGLQRAWIGVVEFSNYYEASQESIARIDELFKLMMENDIPIEYSSNLDATSNYFAKRYAVPEIIYNPSNNTQEEVQSKTK